MAGWHHQRSGHELGQIWGDWWGTWGPAVLQSMGSQRVGHNRATEQQGINACCVRKRTEVREEMKLEEQEEAIAGSSSCERGQAVIPLWEEGRREEFTGT